MVLLSLARVLLEQFFKTFQSLHKCTSQADIDRYVRVGILIWYISILSSSKNFDD